MDFPDYIAGMSSAEKQKLLAAQLLARKSMDNSGAIAGANRQAHSGDMLAAIAAMANNPGAAQAADMMAKSRQSQHGPKVVGQTGFLLPGSGDFLENPVYTGEKGAERELRRDLQDSQAVAARERQSEALALRETLARQAMQSSEQMRLLQLTLGREQMAQRAQQADADRQNRLLIATLGAGLRSDKAASATDERAQRDIDRAIAPWVEKTSKHAIPDLVINTNKLIGAVKEAEAKKAPVPGLGMTTSLASQLPFGDSAVRALEGDAALNNRSAMQSLFNALLRKDSGLAVTMGEERRKALELASAKTASEKTVRQVFKEHVVPLMREAQVNHLSALKPEALNEYRRRFIANDPQAFDWTQALPGFDAPAGAPGVAAPAAPAAAVPGAVPAVPGAPVGMPKRTPREFESRYGGQ